MPINKETIISVFDDKLTLMQWLKTINKALEDAVLTGVEITKKGNATLSFKFTFEDGTYLETNDLVLQQGESVVNAFIQNGHLYLTLSNGTNLDAGNVKPVSNFSIDDNQHLIVNYADGTNQDLGAIFNGNVNISGTLNATKVTGDEIVENMTGYSFSSSETANFDKETIFAGAVKNNNKLTLVYFAKLTKRSGYSSGYLLDACRFILPLSVANKLYPTTIAGIDLLDVKTIPACKSLTENVALTGYAQKSTLLPQVIFAFYGANNLEVDVDYFVRLEVTFLLSDNLAQ